MTTGAGNTSYIYDADGNLLIQSDPGSTTLYLSDEEITLTGSTLSGTRYYQLGGQPVAARTGTGSVYYLTGDQEGTQTLAINSSTLAVTGRFYDPYGNTIGSAGAGWPGNRGFQQGTADAATGLTNLGARQYDAGTSAFVSPDPLLAPDNPQDLNPYAYAGDSPPNSQDPSGAMQTGGGAGAPPNPCGVDASASCNPNGGGGVNAGAPSGADGGSGKTPAGGSDGTGNSIAISPHVVIEKNDPYFTSMVNALGDLLGANPGYAQLLNSGNINKEDWVWTLACRDAGPGACNPLFMSQIVPGSDNAPEGSVYVIGAVAGPAGFAIGTSQTADPAYETYFRSMSAADYSQLQATGQLPASGTGETMISPTQFFSESYSGVLVRFTLKEGTTDAIANVGVSDGSRLVKAAYPDMPPVYRGWMSDAAYFKTEGGAAPQINIGLGKGPGLDAFNDGMVDYDMIAEIP